VGGLFLIREEHAGSAEPALATARDQFARHGFSGLQERRFPGWALLHAPYIVGGPELFASQGEDFAVAAGTLAYDGLTGRAALRKLLAEADPRRLDWSRLAGQFALVLHRSGRTFIATDFFAAFQLYHDADMRLFSTSLLSAARVLPSVSFDTQGVYEYAFQAAVLGDDTVFREIKRLGPNRVLELDAAGSIRSHSVTKELPSAPTRAPAAERLDSHRSLLTRVIAEQVSHFGNQVQCPLSGGLDSRLVLAGLRSLGCSPHIYVYGWPSSPDVAIAKQIGAAEGFPVEWIDKDTFREITPDAFPEQVARNFEEHDALPNFGGMFDNGGNSYARDARHRDGALAVSGGGGEIYRDFFFLPDRPLTASAVTDSFFARFDRRDTTAMFDPRAFMASMRDKMLDVLGRPGDTGRLPRGVIEQIYPRVRCRALFGRELSVEARYSPYLLPFLDQRVVAEAMTLPMPLKRAGLFEAQLLNAIDPVLAARPSAYGHHFAEPPSRRHRFDEWATRVRPIWLRKNSYAIQRRLKPMGDEHGGLESPEYMGRVVDLSFPVMRRYFEVDHVADSALRRRIACLEYLAAHLGSRLRGSTLSP
jgi:asparagine synthase (glutamine-hydrolysing)